MPKVVRSTILDAPIEAVWEVLRDFNGVDRWHPSIDASQMERGAPADKVGCVRKVRLADGSELREQLLGMSEAETMFTYCLLDTPVPLFNYVAHIRLIPVTDGDRTFWQWEGNFTARPEEKAAMIALVDEGIFQAGFAAIREYMGLAGQQG